MLKRSYYVCPDCGWQTEKGNVEWGLIKLNEVPHSNHVLEKCDTCGSLYRNDVDRIAYCCPKCDKLLEITDYTMKNDNAPQLMGIPYKVPIHSDALAITADQVEEHRKLFPNIELDDENRPVFTNTKEHQEYLDKCGVRKQIQKTGKSRGKIFSYPGSKRS